LDKQKQQAHVTFSKMQGGRRMFRDFITLGVQGITSSTAKPNVEVHNFELKSTIISMVQEAQFGGASIEDPNLHLSVF